MSPQTDLNLNMMAAVRIAGTAHPVITPGVFLSGVSCFHGLAEPS